MKEFPLSQVGLKEETIRSDVQRMFGGGFRSEDETWRMFCHTLEVCGLDPSQVLMLSLNQRECPAPFAVYARAAEDHRIDGLALGKGMLVVDVYRDAGLKPWPK